MKYKDTAIIIAFLAMVIFFGIIPSKNKLKDTIDHIRSASGSIDRQTSYIKKSLPAETACQKIEKYLTEEGLQFNLIKIKNTVEIHIFTTEIASVINTIKTMSEINRLEILELNISAGEKTYEIKLTIASDSDSEQYPEPKKIQLTKG